MNTTDKIMALANTYASSNGKALLEKLYGTSQSYTEQCSAEAFKDREALREAIEALARDAEELAFLKNDLLSWVDRAVEKGNANSDIQEASERYDQWLKTRHAAMQEKQS